MPKNSDRICDRYCKQLLLKCFDLFADKGYESLTVRQIAKEIGVSTGTLYHYFFSCGSGKPRAMRFNLATG